MGLLPHRQGLLSRVARLDGPQRRTLREAPARRASWEGSPVGSCRAQEPCGWPHLPGVSFPPGFYLISPSEFERFSLSTKWLVEPRCLVDSAETKSHSRPRNGSGPEKALGRARSVKGQVASGCLSEVCTGGWPEIPSLVS